MQTTLTRLDYENFLLYLYFGNASEPLEACLRRAYLDFSRTIHGLQEFEKKNNWRLYDKAIYHLRTALATLGSGRTGVVSQSDFDTWHERTCKDLKAAYTKASFNGFYIGQAQKWLNMALKYCFVLGEDRIPGFRRSYELCDVPFDNRMIQKLVKKGMQDFDRPWSRVDDYTEYLDRQKWIRDSIPGIPLDLEFRLFMEAEASN
jgi:hypothetical protein